MTIPVGNISLERQLELLEKYRKPEGSGGYDFSGDRQQLAQDMADLGFVDNTPMTMEAITSKYGTFLNRLYGVPEIGGQIPSVGIPGGPGAETAPFRNPDGPGMIAVDPEEAGGPNLPGIGRPPAMPTPGIDSIPIRPSPTMPDVGGPSIPSVEPGIEALARDEQNQGYKKYIASGSNPFQDMGISSLGQDALKRMIQGRNYKSYIG